MIQTPLAVYAQSVGIDMDLRDITPLQAGLFDKDWLGALDELSSKWKDQEPIMNMMQKVEGGDLWMQTMLMCDEAFGKGTRLSRSAYEQITARRFLECMQEGPFPAPSTDDAPVAQAPADLVAVSAAKREPSPSPDDAPVAEAPADQVAVSAAKQEPAPSTGDAPVPEAPVDQVAVSAAPVVQPSPSPTVVRSEAQTVQDVCENYHIKSEHEQVGRLGVFAP